MEDLRVLVELGPTRSVLSYFSNLGLIISKKRTTLRRRGKSSGEKIEERRCKGDNILDDSSYRSYRGCNGPPPSVHVQGRETFPPRCPIPPERSPPLFLNQCGPCHIGSMPPPSARHRLPWRVLQPSSGRMALSRCTKLAVRNSVEGRSEGRNVGEGGRSCISAFFSHQWREAHQWRCSAAL